MQAKHLIIFAIVGIVALLAFNLLGGSNNSVQPVEASAVTTDATTPAANASTNNDIASKPLSQQPKAILDKATTQIDNAQQVENDKMAQVEATAQ
ncbi:MAG: hypothetical protein Q4P13_03830 [Psychrobacter sp.]|nr:hypothetical protein [Psychrobacter sp.]